MDKPTKNNVYNFVGAFSGISVNDSLISSNALQHKSSISSFPFKCEDEQETDKMRKDINGIGGSSIEVHDVRIQSDNWCLCSVSDEVKVTNCYSERVCVIKQENPVLRSSDDAIFGICRRIPLLRRSPVQRCCILDICIPSCLLWIFFGVFCLVYVLARETFLIEDIRIYSPLPDTEAYRAAISERILKRESIEEEFYSSDPMMYRNWTGPNQEMRHVYTRLAIHGYHYQLCRRQHFHEPDSECVCKFCENACPKYHVTSCRKLDKTLTELSDNKHVKRGLMNPM